MPSLSKFILLNYLNILKNYISNSFITPLCILLHVFRLGKPFRMPKMIGLSVCNYDSPSHCGYNLNIMGSRKLQYRGVSWFTQTVSTPPILRPVWSLGDALAQLCQHGPQNQCWQRNSSWPAYFKVNVCISSSAPILIILLRDLYKQINAHDHTKGQIDHMIRAGFIQNRRQIYQSIENK